MQITLLKHLPHETVLQFFVTNGIICWKDNGVPLETDGISGVIILDAARLNIYSCGRGGIYGSKESNYNKSSLLKTIPGGVGIKCLLFFAESNELLEKCVYLLQACHARQRTQIAVGGLLTKSLLPLDISGAGVNPNAYSDRAIAFCGENVEAASQFIHPCSRRESVKRKLREFQKIGLNSENCLAFMFKGSSSPTDYDKEYKYQSSVFHELYPNVPLIGAVGRKIVYGNCFSGKSAWKDDYCTTARGTVYVFLAVKQRTKNIF